MRLITILCALSLHASMASSQPATAPPTSSASQAKYASAEDVEKLRDALAKTREDLAEIKPVTTVTNTVFYFVAGISALLGLFGWRKFSDLDSMVGEQVKLQLPRDQREYARFEELAKNAQEMHLKLKSITEDYERALSNFKFVDVVDIDFDIEGKIAVISQESNRRSKQYIQDDDSGSDSIYEPNWRNSVIALLSRIPEIIKRKNLDGDFLFNIAQLCRRMEQHAIAQEVTAAAYQKLPSPPNKALMLSSVVKAGDINEAPRAFAELLEMLNELSHDQPHIVLAEAWNAAVDMAAFRQLEQQIGALIEKKASNPSLFLPSYIYAIRARCLLSASDPDCVANSELAIAAAKKVLLTESVAARWARQTLEEIGQCERLLMETRRLHASIAPSAASTTSTESA